MEGLSNPPALAPPPCAPSRPLLPSPPPMPPTSPTPIRALRPPADPAIVGALEALLTRANAGELVSLAYFVETQSAHDYGYHGELWALLTGVGRLAHRINVAIDGG